MARLGGLLLALFTLSGCASTKITGFRDLDHTSTQFSSVAVFAQGMILEAAVEAERLMCSKLAPTPCISGKTILPPTRPYTAEEVQEHLGRTNVDAVLIAALVADQSDTQYFGTLTTTSVSAVGGSTGTMNFYGNTAYWNGASYASASGQSLSTPMYGFSRLAFGQLGLFERSTGSIAWRGEMKISGRGLLNITDSAFIDSATSKIAKDIKASGLLK